MIKRVLSILLISVFIFSFACKQNESNIPIDNFEKEKIAILKVLNEETKAAFTRDYQGWKTKWVHEDYVSKTYMNFADSTLSESLGWDKINNFVKTYIEEHPDPVPMPDLLNEIDVRIYGNGAWVEYEQEDQQLGVKRETRLMEKVDGEWKIAGMQTVIYGFKNEE